MQKWLIACVLVLGAAGVLPAQDNLVSGSCWHSFAPRPANSPKFGLSNLGQVYTLVASSLGKRYVYGGWRCHVDGVQGGKYYRFSAQALPKDVASKRESLSVLLRWRGDFGSEVAPTYIWETHPGQQKDALEFDRVVQAPPRTHAADLELVLQWTEHGQVTWSGIKLARAEAPAPRKARVAAVWFRPRGSKTGADSVSQLLSYVEKAVTPQRPDVIVLGEMINHAGSPGSLDDDAEPIPGPTTERVGELARAHSTYVAFSIVERDGADVFNTGVLMDRKGQIAGKYRKVQLPLEEVAAGEAPGDSFPVFQTDFGKVGIMICHDASFAEPARELALNGAELILVPIWGGRTPLVRARAIENGVYVATSGYDYDSEIVDPVGNVLASVRHDSGPAVAVAEVDLSRSFPEDWIGNWRDTVSKQRRDIPYTHRQP